MRSAAEDRGWKPMAFVGVAIYAIFLVTAPFEHHDLLCHLKNPQHCTSCTSSVVGSGPDTPPIFGASHLADAGIASSTHILPEGILLAAESTGRSPPTNC
jgi:hypothetical protein